MSDTTNPPDPMVIRTSELAEEQRALWYIADIVQKYRYRLPGLMQLLTPDEQVQFHFALRTVTAIQRAREGINGGSNG